MEPNVNVFINDESMEGIAMAELRAVKVMDDTILEGCSFVYEVERLSDGTKSFVSPGLTLVLASVFEVEFID